MLVDHRKRDSSRKSAAVTGILDIEENVWSPMFGLKGKIDASVQVKIKDEKGSVSTVVAPLEVKTGRPYHQPSHQLQTIIYTLLLGDRYGVLVLSMNGNAGVTYLPGP